MAVMAPMTTGAVARRLNVSRERILQLLRSAGVDPKDFISKDKDTVFDYLIVAILTVLLGRILGVRGWGYLGAFVAAVILWGAVRNILRVRIYGRSEVAPPSQAVGVGASAQPPPERLAGQRSMMKAASAEFSLHESFVKWATTGVAPQRGQWMPCPRCGSERTEFSAEAANDIDLGKTANVGKIAATILFLFLPIIGWLLIPSLWAAKTEYACKNCQLKWNFRDLPLSAATP